MVLEHALVDIQDGKLVCMVQDIPVCMALDIQVCMALDKLDGRVLGILVDRVAHKPVLERSYG